VKLGGDPLNTIRQLPYCCSLVEFREDVEALIRANQDHKKIQAIIGIKEKVLVDHERIQRSIQDSKEELARLQSKKPGRTLVILSNCLTGIS